MAEDIDDLADELRRFPDEFIRAVKDRTVQSGANIAATARFAAVRGPHTPRFADSIRSRTTRNTASGIEVTVEPVGRLQSKLGAILEFGTATSGPHPVLGTALRDETPVYLRGLADDIGKFG